MSPSKKGKKSGNSRAKHSLWTCCLKIYRLALPPSNREECYALDSPFQWLIRFTIRVCYPLKVLILVALAGLPVFGMEESQIPSAEEIVKRLKETYAPHCCFTAAFDQITVNVSMDLKDRFQGTIHVKRPGWILLDVVTPEKQKVVVKGRSYTVFFPDEGNSVQGEIPPELSVDHFFGFLASIGELDQNFFIDQPTRPFDLLEGLFLIEMRDRKNPASGYQIVVGIDRERFVIRRAIISDALGNYNRFDLTDIRFVPDIPDKLFQVDSGTNENLETPTTKRANDPEKP